MPQLIPFFFVNQVFYVFLALLVLIYVFSRYILPADVALFNTRQRLSN